MKRSTMRLVTTAALALFLPLVASAGCSSCSKKSAAVPEEAAADEPETVDAGVTQLEPLDEDSGPDAAPPAAPRKGGGAPSGGGNAGKIRQCCAAMRKQAQGMGPSPEANIVMGLAAQCDIVAAQAVGGSAPEFGAFRQMLAGRTLPAACSGMLRVHRRGRRPHAREGNRRRRRGRVSGRVAGRAHRRVPGRSGARGLRRRARPGARRGRRSVRLSGARSRSS